jgi:hypothetical protein
MTWWRSTAQSSMPVRFRRFEQFKPFFTGCNEDHMIEKLPLWEALYEWRFRDPQPRTQSSLEKET